MGDGDNRREARCTVPVFVARFRGLYSQFLEERECTQDARDPAAARALPARFTILVASPHYFVFTTLPLPSVLPAGSGKASTNDGIAPFVLHFSFTFCACVRTHVRLCHVCSIGTHISTYYKIQRYIYKTPSQSFCFHMYIFPPRRLRCV